MLFVLFFACAPEHPTDPAECDGIFVLGKARDDCRIEVAITAFEKDPTAAEAWVQQEITDPLQRDFVHLQVTMRVDPSGRYCSLIQDEVLKARCDERAHRPHLNRALPPGPAGGPPPGTPRPVGGPTPPANE